MSKTPMTARPMRQISPLDQGAALMDGQGPFALQQAMADQQAMAEQQAMAQAEQPSAEDEMLESMKAEKDALSKSNKVKELALAIEEELRKQTELEERLRQNPQAVLRLKRILEERGLV